MLDKFRGFAKSPYALVLVGLLIAAFAVWGVEGVFQGGRATAVAEVGDVEVPGVAFEQEFRQYVLRLQAQIPDFTSDQARAIGIDRQVLDSLISRTLLDAEAHELGLAAGDDLVREQLLREEIFRGLSGNFDAQRYREILRQNGYSPSRYEETLRQELVRNQLAGAMGTLGAVPASLARTLLSFEREERRIRYFEIRENALAPIADPDDSVLQGFVESRRGQFRQPERRDLVAVVVNPEDFLDEVDISEDALQAAYETASNRYVQPARRMVDQLLFPSKEMAEAARARIAEGLAFEQIATSEEFPGASLTPLGDILRTDIIDEPVAEAAFTIPVPGVSQVVEGGFGYVIVRATEERAAVVTPLENVRDDLRRELALDNAVDIAFSAANRFEDERAAGTSLEEAAAIAGLEIVAAKGVANGGVGAPAALPEDPDFWTEVFFAAPGDPSALLNVGEQGYAAFRIENIEPARDRTLDEVRAEALEAWRAEETETALLALAENLAKEIESGAGIATVAQRVGGTVRQTGSIQRTAEPGGLGASGLAQAFAAEADGVIFASGARAGTAVVAQVEAIDAPDLSDASDELLQFADGLRQQMSEDLAQSYLAALRIQHGVTVNEELVALIASGDPYAAYGRQSPQGGAGY